MAQCGATLQSVCADLKSRETSLKEAAVEFLHKARRETNVQEPDELPLELKQVHHTTHCWEVSLQCANRLGCSHVLSLDAIVTRNLTPTRTHWQRLMRRCMSFR